MIMIAVFCLFVYFRFPKNFNLFLFFLIFPAERSSVGFLEFESKEVGTEALVMCNHTPITTPGIITLDNQTYLKVFKFLASFQ